LTDAQVTKLVDEGAALDARLKRDSLALAEIKLKLVAHAAKEEMTEASVPLLGSKSRCLVIYPAPRIAPAADKIDVIRRKVGGDAFQTLFDRIVSWRPVKSCRDVANRVLSDSKLREFLELAEVESQPQVRFG
jgi:hypothetical protein